VLVPPHPGVFSAYGLLTAAVERHGVQTIPRGAERSDSAALAARAARLARAVEADLTAQGFPPDAVATRVLADVRYVGQLSELTVPFPSDGGTDLVKRLRAAFDEEHRRTFGHWSPDDPIEVVSVRAIASVASALDGHIGAPRPAAPPTSGERLAYFGERFGWLATPVLGRGQVGASWRTGPLIVEEYDATTVVPPGARVRAEPHGLIEIEVGAA
jgi:N-methylhydantoinase A